MQLMGPLPTHSDNPLHMLMWNNFFAQTSHDRVIYTDCFYRNMYKFNYVAIFDLDEVCLGKLVVYTCNLLIMFETKAI